MSSESYESDTPHGSGFNQNYGLQGSDFSRNCNCFQKHDYLKSMTALKKTNKKLSSDFKLMHNKLQLHDQTTQIKFQLLQKELEESKGEAHKRNHLLTSLLQLLRPELKALSSVDEMISEISKWSGDTNLNEARHDHDTLQQEPQQHYQQHYMQIDHVHSQQQLARHQQSITTEKHQHYQQQPKQRQQQLQQPHYHHVEEKEYGMIINEHLAMKQHMTEVEEVLKVLKEEVEALKQREHRRVSLSMGIEDFKDEEDGRSRKRMLESSVGEDDTDIRVTERLTTMEEELEHHFLPSDTYSYFAVADYFARADYCILPAPACAIACFTLTIQLVTLSIFIMDVVDYKNKSNVISVPPGVSIQVRVSQLIALLISCWNQDEIRASFNVLSLGYRKEKVRAINYSATRYKWHFSIFVRILVGCFSLAVTFILIVNSDTVRDVMLDFAAVTFVSELDNGVFQLSIWGYMGKELQQFAMRIKNVPIYEKRPSSHQDSWRTRKVPRLVWLLIVIGLVVSFWSWVTEKQESGAYLDQSIFVQFGDDFSPALTAFSGIYHIELDKTIDGMRVNYVELGRQSNGRFSYCSQDKRWIFQYGSEPDDYHQRLFSECWHKARSSETESYDLTKTSSISWFVMDEELSRLENPLQHFLVRGQNYYYGKSCENNDECGERMLCNGIDNMCVCEDGLFGLNCEFQEPCQTLELDSRDLNGFFGTRSWSRRYSSLSQHAGNGEDNNITSPIQVYGKPVYVGDESIEGIIDVMVFTGRRWILTDSVSIKDYGHNNTESSSSLKNNHDNIDAKRHLVEFLANNFHAYWSNFTIHFVSEPVDVGTPTDSATPVGLEWFRLEVGTQGASLLSGEQIWQAKMAIEAKLLCAVCHNETNPCFYGATCQADGTCDCTTGSSGRICQIPPANNGNCDVYFNTPEFAFDGGDCCQETCTSTEKYYCGKGQLENSAGVSAYGFVGYPNCQDPRFKSKLSGSTTLYEIVEERGVVRCGNPAYDTGFLEISEDGVYSGFEVDLCKSVAAAALGDPEAIEIVDTTWGSRWGDLLEGKFDVLLSRTTHTAERDVFQSNAKTGFSFSRLPAFFDGVRYAGIPPYAECADKLDAESPECKNLRICVLGGTAWYDVTERLFPDSSIIVQVESLAAEVHGLEAGLCNVIVGVINFVNEFSVRSLGFTGPSYAIGNNIYEKAPQSAATRQDDRVWSKFVSWVFEALIEAEESGITQLTADSLAPTDVFGERFENMFKNAVAAGGNIGEIYERNLKQKIPRGGLNTINTGGSGLIYSFPFGPIGTLGQSPVVRGTIESIRKRGVLRCGIGKSPGFAMLDAETGIWSGFEVDMCRGIAAALLGSPNVNYIPLTSAERFGALADGTVDMLNCATTYTLAREVREVTTGQGFDFTSPTFYDGMGFAGRPPYVGCTEMQVFDSIQDDCVNTRICVPDATTWLDTMVGELNIPGANMIITASMEEAYSKFVLGDCNVIAGESLQLLESSVREFGFAEDEEYRIGAFKYSKEPLAIVSRSDDAQFSDFLRWTVYAFFYAEEAGITRNDYFDMPANNYLFGSALSNMWQHAVEAVGNYGEIYARNFDGLLERGTGPNALNNKNGPQFIAMPGVMINR